METIQQHILEFWNNNPDAWLYLIIPISAAIVGWLTNALAIKMTFYPLEMKGVRLVKIFDAVGFKNIQPVLGWQGIIPSKAGKMAGISVDLMMNKLIDVKEQFNRLDPKIIAQEMESNVERIAREVVQEAMTHEIPLIWKALPNRRKEAIIKDAVNEFPNAVEEMMEELKENINELWDVKHMVITEIIKHKEIVNELFLECGRAEFKFIERSGFYFGFLFGVLQMVLWYFIQGYSWAWVTLPLGGLVIGYLTNVIALKLIFKPENPIKLGVVTFQGLFIKRQKEVAAEYAKIVSEKLFTMENIFEYIIHGKASDKIVDLVEKNVNQAVDKTAGFNRSLIQITSGTKAYNGIKQIAVDRFREELPNSIREIFDYAESALAIEDTFREKMSNLSPSEFVGFMHPVFEEDEWKLILTGAVLGMIAGFLQLLLLG